MPADFDPDRMNADDVDPNNADAVDAWLNHPNTAALHDDLGRAFRAQPADVQRPVIEQVIATDEQRLHELDEMLEARDLAAEHRAGLERIRKALEDSITAARLRLLELDDEA